jgi:hypothetical protein
MPKNFEFNPDRIAYCEANGWRAYYDRKWWQMLRLMLSLCQEQFHIPFPLSIAAAYYVARASIAWVPVDHNVEKVLKYNQKFYQLARRYSSLKFDPAEAAQREVKMWDVHRRLVEQEDKTELVEAMTELHVEIFRLSPEQVRESAEWRVKANDTVDLITQKQSKDIEGDWARLEDYLRQCYRSIQREQQAQRTPVSR